MWSRQLLWRLTFLICCLCQFKPFISLHFEFLLYLSFIVHFVLHRITWRTFAIAWYITSGELESDLPNFFGSSCILSLCCLFVGYLLRWFTLTINQPCASFSASFLLLMFPPQLYGNLVDEYGHSYVPFTCQSAHYLSDQVKNWWDELIDWYALPRPCCIGSVGAALSTFSSSDLSADYPSRMSWLC